jgi:hypothetical protein
MSFEAESNSELTVIVPAYPLHFRFPVQNKIHKQKMLLDTRTGILGSIAGPCDFLPARSDEFQKVCKTTPSAMKKLHKRVSLSLGYNLVVFHYISASEISLDKKGGLWWKQSSK